MKKLTFIAICIPYFLRRIVIIISSFDNTVYHKSQDKNYHD
jgi:hypothetical protein